MFGMCRRVREMYSLGTSPKFHRVSIMAEFVYLNLFIFCCRQRTSPLPRTKKCPSPRTEAVTLQIDASTAFDNSAIVRSAAAKTHLGSLQRLQNNTIRLIASPWLATRTSASGRNTDRSIPSLERDSDGHLFPWNEIIFWKANRPISKSENKRLMRSWKFVV